MISAAVGFQCPECVRDGGRTVREARTQLGGRIHRRSDVVTRTLIAINFAVFVLANLGGPALQERLTLLGNAGFLASTGGPAGVAQGEWYRLITAAFLHIQLAHLALNMIALWLFGPPLEAVLGRWRFLTLYLLSALGGSVASYLFNPPTQQSVGASGAIFGLLGATLVIANRLRFDARAIAILIVLNLVIGFVVSGIDWKAHIGGLITGAVVAGTFVYAPKARRTEIQVVACLVVLAGIIGLVALRTAQLT
jgi:membrane associated rhomboid family serine protease